MSMFRRIERLIKLLQEDEIHMSKLDDACGAIVAAKPLRDTVLVDTVNYRVVRLKDRRKLGAFRLGEIKKRARIDDDQIVLTTRLL